MYPIEINSHAAIFFREKRFSQVIFSTPDIATGDVFGSNLFNIGILAIDNIFFIKGPLLSFIEPGHIVSAVSAIIMMTIATIGLTYRARKKPLFLAWDALGIIVVYILNLIALYMVR